MKKTKGGTMAKTMTKYQLEHFQDKIRRQVDPLIEEQELLVKQYKTKATDSAVQKLSKKMGADKIINKFREAEKMLAEARATALTFFEKKKPKEEELNYKFRNSRSSYRDNDEITLSDCEEQLRTWASTLAEREIERRPEGKRLAELKQIKRVALDTVMEAEAPAELINNLDKVFTKAIGSTWNEQVPQLENKK
ncbi:MAG: hypothetical protein VW810_00085 [Pelagibacteraceae bacterium]